MVSNIVKRVMWGLSCSAIITFVALTILKFSGTEASVSDIWLNMLGSIVMGVYFGVASYIFQHEKWSPLKQVILHFLLSVIVYFPTALGVGWLPLEPLPILAGLAVFMIVYTIFWLSLRFYFRKQAEAMNNSMKRK